jgi:[acyl-carrier-protein] S-malonyltransferase
MKTGRLALLFPGGGTQYPGMGKALYDSSKIAKELFEEANDILGFNLRRICFEGTLSALSAMNIAQPAIFTVSLAAAKVWMQDTGIQPAFACGHSLGELTALTAAGVFSFEKALSLVHARGILLSEAGQQLNAGMMAVNKMPAAVVEAACEALNNQGAQVYVAVYNSPLQQVVAGNRKDMALLADKLQAAGAETVLLQINTPSHCPLMAAAGNRFREELSACTPGPFSFPVISNVTARPYGQDTDITEMLTRHMTNPVRWEDSITYLKQQDITSAVETQPQAVLKQLMPYITPDIRVYALDVAEDLIKI